MTASAAAAAPPRARRSTDDELDAIRRPAAAATRTTSSSRCSASCGASTARTRARGRCCATLPTGGRRRRRRGRARTPGVISIGDGLAVAFKIESHNHPRAVEPYQGAATGVGGILRDIFAMGARPIAVLDALRFGDPADARTRHLVDGVVRGVGGYGNCVGVPTVGGELVFDPSYAGQPAGQRDGDRAARGRLLTRAAAPGPGNLVVLFGSTTGRDGIGGASRPRQRDVRRRGPVEATRRSRSATRSRRSC